MTRVERVLTLCAVFCCLGGPVVVALLGLGAPVPGALAGAVLLAAGAGAWSWRSLPGLPLAGARRHPVVAAIWIVALAAAAVQTARTSVYMHDVEQPRYSIDPDDSFRVEHNCLTAYAEAARFAGEGDVNIYDSELYRPGGAPRRIGPLTVDRFHYPPPFLLLPTAVRALAPDFLDVRRIWFGLQAVVLGLGLLALAAWIGGREGRFAALAAVAVWAFPQTLWALQMGNFQVTAIPLAIGGLALAVSHPFPGAALLTYAAAGKIFPSMLVLHVLATRRWRLVGWICGCGVALAVVTAAVYGVDVFAQFLHDEVPELASGAAFPQTEQPRTVPVNQSIYGLTVKLRQLGLGILDPTAGKRVAQVYAALLAGLAIVAGARARGATAPAPGRDRLRLAAMWLAILNLASFAGPFVGGGYASVGSVWLLTLLVAGAAAPRHRWGWLAAAVPLFGMPLLLPSPSAPADPSAWILVVSIVGQLVVIAINVWAVWSWVRERGRARVPARSAV